MIRKLALAAALLFTTAFATLATQNAQAAPESRGWAGGLLGITIPDADNTSSRGLWGITAGAKLGSEWGIGGYYLTSKKDEDFGNFDFDLYGIQFGYHFEGEANGAFIAGRVGTSKIEVLGASDSPTNVGVVIGYDYMLAEHFSLGGEASFMNVATDDSFTLLSFNGAAKFWF